ncbi:conjugal transfer protein TraH [Amycolatopsis sp. DSM 110486]|uniref:conjugal transfer protein TraH n=1 Tax=Amycolatopsis sp. DSM 110486 TaxID=2865832 RepID=UPI001C6A54C3|nr:conjugal transfer protein TraH [Amycolatopsis sp. DSM 110486]QYN23152.1 conjugal transfer protein TraH [Amycolatopsis sp. DSM 110486]
MTEQHPCRTRTEKALVWTVGRFGELAAVGAPVVIGAFTTSWLDLLSAAIAAVWAAHEIRLHRATRQARTTLATAPEPRQLHTIPATSAEQAGPGGTESSGRREAKA